MNQVMKVALWVSGAILLVILIQYPIQQTTDSWDSWSLPLAGQVIVLDPGHGGVDGGAVGVEETLEKDISLIVTKKIRDYLQQSGALVYMTRESDRDLAATDTKGIANRKVEDIKNRVAFINGKEPDFFLSIHLNALPATQWSGAQTFYYPGLEKSENLAKSIQDEIKRNLENTNRDVLAINNMYLLKHTNPPGALVEIGFLSNAHERELLKTTSYQTKMAASIYEGILHYATSDNE
ncbi:germination-specific N-acetylmuramoyl-L-alanine amidase [Paraliobacillus quinghaiensis]|uniref:Germination-specific N-acetylmuramoyl-L-alanine amidase n=1 Tax=Paraliobacillus quinghaiensis TaxID=470815 RepID=A0A917TZP8_9BACI|nr:N-acetylmuramoyl-L-alanine amidase CwlD [Paraliobacillus quinghaiensis]GGM43408.1 germination-specific N-acetylmuramoyl-L-alanine amidase [Paraliobacillus quinghaiensis]